MSHEVLQNIVGMAVIDRSFRRRLLENPKIAVDGFELTPEEVEAVVAIEAGTIEEFAQQLHEWVNSRNGHVDEESHLREALAMAVGAPRVPQDREVGGSTLR